MNFKETILKELEQNFTDYFVVTKEISSKISSIEELKQNKIDNKSAGLLKKDTYLYQFYNIFLVKIISNIRLLYKIVKLESIDIDADYEEKLRNIIESDPETMVVEGDNIVIIDEQLKDIVDNKLTEVSKEEFSAIEKSITNNEESK